MPGWGAPQTTQGFTTGDYAGALVLLTVVAYEPLVPTQYGDKDAVTCHITVCYHPTDSSKAGEGYVNARIFNTPIVGALRNAVGSSIGGRITRGIGQGGNTKFTLDPADDENSKAYLDHYWSQHCENYGVNPDGGQLIETAADRDRKAQQKANNDQAARESLQQAPPPPPAPATAPMASTPPPMPPQAPAMAPPGVTPPPF